jgi:hypothetical protein
MEDFRKNLNLISKATKEKPWNEWEYVDTKSLDKFINFLDAVNNIARLNPYNHSFLFRGQSNSEWGLEPKIVRFFKTFHNITRAEALRIEFDTFNFFKQQAHVYLDKEVLPRSNYNVLSEFIEWISLMQHFSAPTRMLDWSTSFNVALYFAVTDEPLDKKGSVWFFQKDGLDIWMDNKYPYPKELQEEEYQKKILTNHQDYINFGINQALPKIIVFDKQRKFQRVMAQGSIFIYSHQLFVDHAFLVGNALLDIKNSSDIVILNKILISPAAKKYFRRHLSKLNITASSLFPGIDGIGRAISEIARVECEDSHFK